MNGNAHLRSGRPQPFGALLTRPDFTAGPGQLFTGISSMVGFDQQKSKKDSTGTYRLRRKLGHVKLRNVCSNSPFSGGESVF
jgi:hypothetical protein